VSRGVGLVLGHLQLLHADVAEGRGFVLGVGGEGDQRKEAEN
jgi:hypothetical protein